MGCAGNAEIRSPNLDRLARQGIRFDHFFCTSPVCSPARASILTGRIPSQHGVHDFLHWQSNTGSGGLDRPVPADGVHFLAGMTTYARANGSSSGDIRRARTSSTTSRTIRTNGGTSSAAGATRSASAPSGGSSTIGTRTTLIPTWTVPACRSRDGDNAISPRGTTPSPIGCLGWTTTPRDGSRARDRPLPRQPVADFARHRWPMSHGNQPIRKRHDGPPPLMVAPCTTRSTAAA